MTDREKLIEWMTAIPPCPDGHDYYTCKGCRYVDEKGACDEIAMVADIMIANGVVVREKGEWDTVFYERNTTISTFTHICPKCKYLYRDIRFKGHDFCPNCGADMRKGENDG